MRTFAIVLFSILPYSSANSHVAISSSAAEVAPINFNNFSLGSYGGSKQDVEGEVEVTGDGLSLTLRGNRWQYIDFPYTISPNTVIEFDFYSEQRGEIHGLGMDTDLAVGGSSTFKLYGTQNYGHKDFNLYQQGQTHYTIPIGEYYQGLMSYLFFANDHDQSDPNAHSQFSNLRIYENQLKLIAPLIESQPNSIARVNQPYAYDNDHQIDVVGTVPIQFELIVGPEGLTLSEQGLLAWTPKQEDVGEHPVEILVRNSVGIDKQNFTIRVTSPNLVIDFQDSDIEAYGGAQDGSGIFEVHNANSKLSLLGNQWKKIDVSVEITLDTVLEFDFFSNAEGEIHGIGLDIDSNISSNRTIKVFGTQKWGIRDFDNYAIIEQLPSVKHYVIPIGQYYTGFFNTLFFVNDHDVPYPSASSEFSNIRIYSSETLDCGEIFHGNNITRQRFSSDNVPSGEVCVSESQTSTCNNGTLSAWTGTFAFESCSVSDTTDPNALPLIEMDAFEYQGGFRVTSAKFGSEQWGKADYSLGIFTYNPDNHSIFLAGHPYDGTIAEFRVPEIVNSTQVSDFNQIQDALQDFVKIQGTTRVDTGISDYFRVTGMEIVDGQLMVNYINWYDASGTETDTSIMIKNASDLQNSQILGPYQLQGAAHSAGWLSAIPSEWQSSLEGTYISGSQAGASIISRLSVGPSAFIFDPLQSILAASGPVQAQGLLDFSLANMLYDKSLYSAPIDVNEILYNDHLDNDLWTIISGAGYGFIVPGTRTYVTVGSSGGHETGLGYKITQDNGNVCGGPCPYGASDYSNYYWLWDVSDLIRVKNGEIAAYDVRPYRYGKFEVPLDFAGSRINGGAFDANTGMLYLSLPGADTEGTYSRPPLFIVYKIDL